MLLLLLVLSVRRRAVVCCTDTALTDACVLLYLLLPGRLFL
jgi:hypothetical protein